MEAMIIIPKDKDLSLVATVALALVATFLLLMWRRRVQSGRGGLPPGPWGVPVLGYLPFLDPNMHRHLAELAKSYGPILSLRLGTRLHVTVSSPALAAEIFKTNDALFANHPVPSIARIINGGYNMLWSPYGPHWRMARKVVVQEVLCPSVIESFLPLRRREVQRMLVDLRSRAGSAVNLRETVSKVSLGVMMGMIWDDALREDKGRNLKRELLEIIDDLAETVGTFNIAEFIPALRPLDPQGLYRRATALAKRLHDAQDSIISERMSKGGGGGRVVGGRANSSKDFLQILLDNVQKKDQEVPLEIKHVKAMLEDIIFAGTDTSASSVEWAMTELMQNPRVMSKAREELEAVVGLGSPVEESHIPSLEYLGAILKETMRLHPVLPLLIPHAPSETCTVGGYTIPKGTSVMVNVWAIQRDPSIWEAPLEFRPERFLEEKNKGRWDFTGKSSEYLPFGAGRRTCVGSNLGQRISLHTLASLVHGFTWSLPEDTPALHADDRFGIMLKKKDPLRLVPIIATSSS